MRTTHKTLTTISSIAALTAGVLVVSTPAHAAKAVKSAKGVNAATATSLKDLGGMDALVKAAQKEGTLNVIALPRAWANYGEAMDLFTKAFGIKINNDSPDGSSAYEIQTIKTAPKSKQPDVVDIGISHLAEADNGNLYAPYKVQTWNDIPDSAAKDASGRYFPDYYGQIALSYDASIPVPPTSFKDLLKPDYKGMVAIGGDPSSATEALMSVFAANAVQGGTPENVQKGVDYFHQLKQSGNFVSALASGQNFIAGAYKVSFSWDFNGPGAIDAAAKAGKSLKFVMPTDVVLQGTPYLQAINKTAPHPAAARLWEEFLYSQNKGQLTAELSTTKAMSGSKIFSTIMGGQNIWISGAAHPATEAAMRAKGVAINPPAGLETPKSATVVAPPTPDQQTSAQGLLKSAWPAI